MSVQYGGDKITFADGSSTASGYTGFKNRIINGAMVIDQRNAGSAVSSPSNNDYLVDRWQINTGGAGIFTWQQNKNSATPPAGFTNYCGMTSSAATVVGSTDAYCFRTNIEGYNVADLNWGSANAKTVTLSFWVQSSLTGTFGCAIQNSSLDRSYPFTYNINSANTWEYKTVTIPGDTSGTWVTNNGNGLRLWFSVGTGSGKSGTANSWATADYRSASSTVSVVAVSGATWYITGVQLEVGNTATTFEYRPYGTELQLCQRYYKRFTRVDSNGSADAGSIVFCNWTGANAYGGVVLMNPAMRAAPTLSYSSLSDFQYLQAGSVKTPTNFQLLGASPTYTEQTLDWTGGLTSGQAGWLRIAGSTGWFAFSAEL